MVSEHIYFQGPGMQSASQDPNDIADSAGNIFVAGRHGAAAGGLVPL